MASSLLQMLDQLHSLVGTSGVKIVTVKIEEIEGSDAQSNPNWTNIRSTPDDRSSYLEQCPVNRVPYFIIVGRDLKCKEIHVPFEELKTKIDWFAAKRDNE